MHRFARALRIPDCGAAATPLPVSILSPSDRSFEQFGAGRMPETPVTGHVPYGETSADGSPRLRPLPAGDRPS